MTVINPPIAVQSRTDTNADDFRSALMAGMAGLGTTPLPRGGILPGWGAGLSVAQRGAGANMSVDVGSGACLLPSPTVGTGGWYVVNDATLNLAIAAANATLPRIDLVIARVADPQYHVGGDGLAAVKVVTGTAAASPVAPTVPTSDGAFIVLGQVAVAAAAASITNGNITANTSASRAFTVAAGGILPVANAAARTAITNPHLGLHVIEADTAAEYVWTGAAWAQLELPNAASAWAAWTPTWTALTPGNGTNASRFRQIGKTVFVQLAFTLGSTSSVASTPKASLPVPARVGTVPVLSCELADASVGIAPGGADITAGTALNLYGVNFTSGYLQVLSATFPFTWAVGDQILVTGTYEAA